MHVKNHTSDAALILGGHVNGYNIAKELHGAGVENILLLDYGRSVAKYSNKVKYCGKIVASPNEFLVQLKKLYVEYGLLVIYPTDDLQLELLASLDRSVHDICYLPFNQNTITQVLDKSFQYQVCADSGIPYPKSISLEKTVESGNFDGLIYPLIIKPVNRKDLSMPVFRNLFLESENKLHQHLEMIRRFLSQGVNFLVSEYIPGDDTNIHAYTCFIDRKGAIINEWTGRKLTQYPDNYGVFSSSVNEENTKVLDLGRQLVKLLDSFGVVEPEFKYDSRDGQYKLMEVNLRSMMWHYTGAVSGVKLHYSQYLSAVGGNIRSEVQENSERVHFVLMMHELPNLIARAGYFRHFKSNVFGGDKRVWAIYTEGDIKPFLFSLFVFSKMVVSACLRRFGLR